MVLNPFYYHMQFSKPKLDLYPNPFIGWTRHAESRDNETIGGRIIFRLWKDNAGILFDFLETISFDSMIYIFFA